MTGPRPHLATRIKLPSAAGRTWYRLVSSFRSRHVRLVYSPMYRVDLGVTPVDVLRAERILAFLFAYGLLPAERLLRPEIASLQDLRLAHDRVYLEALRRPGSLTEIVGFELWPELHRQALLAQRAAVGGTILATAQALRENDTVFNLGGGFHHASRLQGKGFCIFNDVAVAIARARRDGFSGRILVVDLDLHDGNGTRDIFRRDSSVFTLSIHNSSWDREPAEASLSVELGADVADDTYLRAVRQHLPRLFEVIRPQLVYYLAGTDPAADDRIGNWRLSEAALLQRDQIVIDQIVQGPGRLPAVLLLAGGYGDDTWRYTARFLAWLLLGSERIEPPSTTEMTLARYRHLTQELRQSTRQGKASEEVDWGLSEADLIGGLGADSRQALYLGHYSHHAIELAAEWTGILDRLREMGFAHPAIELDLDNPGGDTLRIFADSRQSELLVELRLRWDRRTIPGMEVLSLEWLLLQNPRANFSHRAPKLPGQNHPGLGLVKDVMSLLILMTDQLQLDGIVFVPSQYHLAQKARTYLKFLEPEDEGWFRALSSTLEGLPLDRATDLVASGAVEDRTTGDPVRWRPMPMVLPISDRLHDRVEEGAYELKAEEAWSRCQFLLTSQPDVTSVRPTPEGSA